jgi:DegV family protein with EDD domain
MPRRVALVTDSTSIDPEVARSLDVVVVPLQVVIDGTAYDEGLDATPSMVATALKERAQVSTSRPPPEVFLRTFQRAAASGAEEVVSIHLSAEVSGTLESAELAAREAAIPVHPVDSRQLGIGTGFAVESAAAALAAGGSAVGAVKAAETRAAAIRSLFYVDTLDYLRRGGRVGTAAALLGSALAVKPLLQIEDGRIVPLEKVRTSAKAISRLEELAVAAAAGAAVDVAVSHLDNPNRAAELAGRLEAMVPNVQRVLVTEVGAVIGAHVGPGMLAVVVAPHI